MKKKILFVIPSLSSGGAEKSLVSVLKLFDYSRYDVDLFAFKAKGLFIDKIPDSVTVYDAGENFGYFDGDIKKAIAFFLKKGRPDLAAARIAYALALKSGDSYARETKSWELMKKAVSFEYKKYDCVIGYLEGTADWFAGEYPYADKKIGYMHSYLDKTDSDKKHFGEVVSRFDYFAAVSDECEQNLKKEYPDYGGFTVIHNIVSPTLIKDELTGEKLPDSDGALKLLTVGRLSHEKGPDIAVRACAALKEKSDSPFKWYHIGSGREKDNIVSLIKELGVEDCFILLGEKSNPYPYFADCDIYVQPSRYEGKSIAIDEAKCLYRPVVVTDFPSVYDQITDGETGIICKTDHESVAKGVLKLLNDGALRHKLSENLRLSEPGNESEIQKLYELIES